MVLVVFNAAGPFGAVYCLGAVFSFFLERITLKFELPFSFTYNFNFI